jgi:uncharacterized membrane protein (DUF485 family)
MTQPTAAATDRLRALARERSRIAITLTVVMIAVYFGFIMLIAFAKGWLGRTLVPGLSFGIVLGAVVIVATWLLTWIYVRWANTHYDPALRNIDRGAV